MTRGGGWPMTVFLLPNGQPFYGGTYFPPEPRQGMPGFKQILTGVADAYHSRRAEVEQSAQGLTESLDRDLSDIGGAPTDPNAAATDARAVLAPGALEMSMLAIDGPLSAAEVVPAANPALAGVPPAMTKSAPTAVDELVLSVRVA